jgi:Piwi domain.
MKIELIKEPLLEFGDNFMCDDPKMGIGMGGFFSVSNKTHRTELHFGVIGTQNNIQDLQDYIAKFEQKIEANPKDISHVDENETIVEGEIVLNDDTSDFEMQSLFANDIKNSEEEDLTFTTNKKINPDFPGFNSESCFNAEFVNDSLNNYVIKESEIKDIFKMEGKLFDKAIKYTDLIIEGYNAIQKKAINKPNVIFIIIGSDVYKKFASIPQGNYYFNLRRFLKAQLISLSNPIPVQIILEDTLTGKKKSIQDLSMQAWNFVVANYYKNGGTPWALKVKDKDTCFIGISFHKALNGESNQMRASLAQAFNYEGKGLIFIGDQFEWDSEVTNTPAPHLTYGYAKDLVKRIIKQYSDYNRHQPSRVVIHKTTDYWDSFINKDYAEVEGLKDGIHDVLGDDCQIDLVAIKESKIRLLRNEGIYPVMRGTLLEIDKVTGVLYSTGYIPYYEGFPGVHIPNPIEIHIYDGESTLRKVCEEILALTKMNFNNCNYYDRLPITVKFARKVGEIVQYLDDGIVPPNKYYFYM